MKKSFPTILIILCILGVGIYAIYNHIISRDYYNDSYVNGNTAGNLYNSGLFCEYDGIIYFSNINDGNRLYQMNADGTNIQKISTDSAAFINADENYIYYTRTGDNSESQFSFLHVYTHSLCKLRRDLKGEVKILDTDPCMYASLVGNDIYYIHYNSEEASTLYKIQNDGKEKGQVFPQPYFTCSTDRNLIYYNGLKEDHNVYCYDTAAQTQTLLYEGNCWMPIVEGNYLYFMDCEDNYSLIRVDLTTGSEMILTDDRIDCFNIHNGVVYFQRNGSTPALCSVRSDGSDYKVLKEGIFTNIHTAGNFVFFKDYSSELFYKMPLNGGAVSVFNPGIDEN